MITRNHERSEIKFFSLNFVPTRVEQQLHAELIGGIIEQTI